MALTNQETAIPYTHELLARNPEAGGHDLVIQSDQSEINPLFFDCPLIQPHILKAEAILNQGFPEDGKDEVRANMVSGIRSFCVNYTEDCDGPVTEEVSRFFGKPRTQISCMHPESENRSPHTVKKILPNKTTT